MKTITTDQALFLLVDVQEKLVPAMAPDLWTPMEANLHRWGKAVEILGLPTLISEQYPKGLGSTQGPIRSAFVGATVHEKMSFDVMGEAAIADALVRFHRRAIIVAGMETHICVFQTVRSLAAKHDVFVLADAVASRTRENYEIGLNLMKDAGAMVTSTEAVLFDLLRRAGSDAFKAISKLVR